MNWKKNQEFLASFIFGLNWEMKNANFLIIFFEGGDTANAQLEGVSHSG